MSKTNPLAGLIGNYGDSDDETEEVSSSSRSYAAVSSTTTLTSTATAAIHPAPIPHCPWSACYDETSGFTYYWNQNTNAVTWDAPPEYLLALKLAQQQLHTSGSTEVSAEEWQLYQQALAEKQNSQNKSKAQSAVTSSKLVKKNDKQTLVKDKKYAKGKSKRPHSDDEDEKIELITSYYHSDSDEDEEAESPAKPKPAPPKQPAPQAKPPLVKQPAKKQKVKSTPMEYGPSLPPNQNYSIPIGPELPPHLMPTTEEPAAEKEKEEVVVSKQEEKTSKKEENEDLQDESALLSKLKDKAKLLEKLGGEIPSELRDMIKEETGSRIGSPLVSNENSNEIKAPDTNIDDLLDEIEKKELPKVKTKSKIDIFVDEDVKSANSSARNSPKSRDKTPPLEEIKSLFPSSKAIVEEEKPSLFPSAVNIQETETEVKVKETVPEKKSSNVYLPDETESVTITKKKLRISNSVLPERKTKETPSYTTKYSQHIEGFSGERKGLGFSQSDDSTEDAASEKKTVNYGNGLMFTKGETLNEDKKDDDLDDQLDLVESKLKYLNQLQPCAVSPVQEMLIQMQTLLAAFRSGDLSGGYLRRWVAAASAALLSHETQAAPSGWTCVFQRSEQRYQYVRADGHAQWEYPVAAVSTAAATAAATAAGQCDMDICTTPPHPGIEEKPSPPPLPVSPPPRPATPPPPRWSEPPPPGCQPPLPPEPEIGDELQSFYKDIAELEHIAQPPLPPQPPPPPAPHSPEQAAGEANADDKHKEKDVKPKKKSKVKISSSVGLKHKSVSSLVAKWQQVAEEINSD